jgi:hypothetical protein
MQNDVYKFKNYRLAKHNDNINCSLSLQNLEIMANLIICLKNCVTSHLPNTFTALLTVSVDRSKTSTFAKIIKKKANSNISPIVLELNVIGTCSHMFLVKKIFLADKLES